MDTHTLNSFSATQPFDPAYDPVVSKSPGQGRDYAPTYWIGTAGAPPADDGPVRGDMDVEVRDDRLIVFRPGGFDLLNPATWQRFERIRETLGAKALTRTDRYVDERVASPENRASAPAEVGTDGARLKTRLPGGVWLGVGIAAGALVFAGTIVTVILTSIGAR